MDGPGVVAAAAPPRVRLTQAQARSLGERLAMEPRDRHRAREVAATLGVSASWVRTLIRRARRGAAARPVGRPRTAEAERTRVRALVERERAEQGDGAGSRPILDALRRREPGLSQMLVEQELSALKAEARARARTAAEATMEGVEILGRDTVWGEDTTHLGRLDDGSECAGEHVRDLATSATVSLRAGPPPTARDVLEGLRAAAAARGGWPLVIQRDNGRVYADEGVRAELAREHVVELRSRVHTPTDNPATERAHRELKAEAGLGKGTRLSGHEEARARVASALARLHEGRLRASRGGRTTKELDAVLPRADAVVDRDRFYEATRAAVEAATRGLEDLDAARKAEREAVISTLCELGLARRHVGRRPRNGRVPWPDLPRLAPCEAGGKG